MYIQERDQYTERYKKGPGCLLWLAWLLVTTVGVAIGQTAGQAVERAVRLPDPLSLFVLAAAGALAGLISGSVQGLVLLPYLKKRGWAEWTVATIIGRSSRWILVSLANGLLARISFEGSLGVLAAAGVVLGASGVAGAVMAVAQARVLRRRVQHAGWWVWANVIGSAFYPLALAAGGNIFYWLTRSPIEDRDSFEALSNLVAGAFTGAITGYALLDLLRHPGEAAEWQPKWRPPRQSTQPRNADTQPSPEVLLEQLRGQERPGASSKKV